MQAQRAQDLGFVPQPIPCLPPPPQSHDIIKTKMILKSWGEGVPRLESGGDFLPD